MRLSAPIPTLKRRARLNARKTRMPYLQALDAIAADEGFSTWSALTAATTRLKPTRLSSQLRPGELVLLAARPRRGKNPQRH